MPKRFKRTFWSTRPAHVSALWGSHQPDYSLNVGFWRTSFSLDSLAVLTSYTVEAKDRRLPAFPVVQVTNLDLSMLQPEPTMRENRTRTNTISTNHTSRPYNSSAASLSSAYWQTTRGTSLHGPIITKRKSAVLSNCLMFHLLHFLSFSKH